MTLDFILIRSCDIETKVYGICKTDQHFKSPIPFTASLWLIKIKQQHTWEPKVGTNLPHWEMYEANRTKYSE